MRPSGAEKDWEIMKKSGMSETIQTLMRKSVCVMLSLLLLLPAVFPVKAAAETAPAKVVRVGSFEDTFNYINKKGARKGYGYELLETLSGYTGWQFEYVTCDWSDCFEKLENGEIDIMGDISYTEDRAEKMLFSDEPMGEEKYYLYADLSRADISTSNFKTLNGKKIGVLMGTEPEVMLTEWEEKYGLKTEQVNISNNEDVKQKLANHEVNCFVSLEESFSDKKSLLGVKILLTEDNDLNAEIAAELLQEEGCTVERAKDGVECVDMLEKAANGTYQLILMDIQMPVMNGYDAAKKIRRMEDPQKADIPIIAMTANAFSEDRQAALDAGMNDHVAKPINMNVLVPTIRKYL